MQGGKAVMHFSIITTDVSCPNHETICCTSKPPSQKSTILMQLNDAVAKVYFISKQTIPPEVWALGASVLFFLCHSKFEQNQWRSLTDKMPLVENYKAGILHTCHKLTVHSFKINTLTIPWTQAGLTQTEAAHIQLDE